MDSRVNPDTTIALWKTKDGETIHIHKMDDHHLKSSILMIKHHPKLWRLRWLPTLEAEFKRRFPNEQVP